MCQTENFLYSVSFGDRKWGQNPRFVKSVSLAAVVDINNYHATGLIEAEKNAPLADAQAIPAFQCTLQGLDVAATIRSKRFQCVKNTLRVGSIHMGKFALSGSLIDEKAFHRPSCCFKSL